MTNEDIIKRLAEIEGTDLDALNEVALTYGRYPWNPLDWADLGPLIEKKQIDIVWDAGGRCKAFHRLEGAMTYHNREWQTDVKRACCLAIIEANQ